MSTAEVDVSEADQNWLVVLPTRWEIARLGQYFSERRETVSDVDYVPLSVTKDGIVPQLESAAKTDKGDNRKRVARGDFVINSRSDRKGSAGVSGFDGSVSTISIVLTPRGIDGRFAHYLLRSQPFQEEFYRFGSGIVADLWSTRWAQMRDIKIPVPPVEEQRAIVGYLDRETGRIDALIAKQEQLIEMLEERARAVRFLAVSGAATVSLGLYAEVQSGFAFPSSGFTSEASAQRLLRGINVNPGRINWTEEVRWTRESSDGLASFELHEGDVVLGMDRPIVGGGVRVAQIGPDDLPALLLQRVARVRPRQALSNDYLYLLLGSQQFADHLAPSFTGVSVPHISPDQISSFKVAVPPRPEQVRRVRWARDSLGAVDRLKACTAGFVALLRERRQALIAAAVTGQIEMRDR